MSNFFCRPPYFLVDPAALSISVSERHLHIHIHNIQYILHLYMNVQNVFFLSHIGRDSIGFVTAVFLFSKVKSACDCLKIGHILGLCKSELSLVELGNQSESFSLVCVHWYFAADLSPLNPLG